MKRKNTGRGGGTSASAFMAGFSSGARIEVAAATVLVEVDGVATEVPAERCPCGSGLCMLCDDNGMVPA
jgi:hypothetical protein